jgi:membrane peptidoglycan carboxypeptidase
MSAQGMAKSFAWATGLGIIGAISGALGILAVVFSMVYFGDDSALKKSTIMARINEETTIYMLDEQTQIGSIFANAHRRYIPIDEVPAHMINAIIASEDKNFYNHHGVDPAAIFSAGIDFLSSGHMRGASTLTQQTVRNILGWWELSLSRKFREWIAALQIERLYPKRQILEFYLNQFYVSGNGNGIGIAAKYYFNKEVRDLDLVESAFIAGSVKGPSTYDPFIKFTKESREKAINRAYIRKNYVLKRMYEQGWITEEQFKEAYEKPVKFNRGRFRSEEVSLVQLIKSELNKKEILEALGIDDPRELSNAGLKIYTTIDSDLQQSAQLAVRRNLSRLDSILLGYKAEAADRFEKRRSLTVNDFYYAQVTEIGGTKKEPELKVNFGLPNGTIPFESLKRYAMWLDLSSGRGWEKQLSDMIKEIRPGDILFVEVKDYDVETHEALCEMHKRPRINGGLIAIDKGEVRAVVSGFDTKGFNRSMAARRQPGSVFKAVTYFGALQLGWSVLDRLDNERQIFPFQGRFYYPRGDHDSPYSETSMLWSGIMSENLASVSLASRMVEKLNLEQFKQLMGTMDLLPHPGEAPRDFHYRVARATGVQLDNEGVREYQLKNAVNDLLLDVQYNSNYEYQSKLKKMWWGRGYVAEMHAIYANSGDDLSFKADRLKLLLNNMQRLSGLDVDFINDWQAVQMVVNDKGYEAAYSDPGIQHLLERFRVLPGAGNKPALGYAHVLDTERSQRDYATSPNRMEIEKRLLPQGRPINPLDIQAIWGGSALLGSADISMNDVLLDGWLPHGHYTLLKQYVDRHYEDVMARQDDYDLHRYWQHHDFRIGLGLKYLVQLTHAMGVTSKIDPVLSFPLGTNDVSAAEVAMIYQTFISGKVYRFYEEGAPNQLNFLRRIEDRSGNTLYEPKRREFQLVMPEFALQMREILRRVITHGTGRRARGEIYATIGGEETNAGKGASGRDDRAEKRIGVPAFGKTGTTNDYNNAYFAGFIPYPTEKGAPLDPENSYVISAYVGYDQNKKMQKNFFKVSGSQGPLPAWWTFAKSIIDKKKYADMLDDLDLSTISRGEWALKADTRGAVMLVDLPRGVALDRVGNDQDTFVSTNIGRDGEKRDEEFRASVVQAAVRIPLDDRGSALRVFSPFKLPDPEKGVIAVSPSKVDDAPEGKVNPRASVTMPGGDVIAAPLDQGGGVADPATRQDPVAASGGDVWSNQNVGSQVTDSASASPKEKVQEILPEDASKTEDLFKDNYVPAKENAKPPAKAEKDVEEDDDAGFVEEELW